MLNNIKKNIHETPSFVQRYPLLSSTVTRIKMNFFLITYDKIFPSVSVIREGFCLSEYLSNEG